MNQSKIYIVSKDTEYIFTAMTKWWKMLKTINIIQFHTCVTWMIVLILTILHY